VLARECLLRITAQIDEKMQEISIKEQIDVYCFLHDLQRISAFNSCIGLLEQCLRKWNLQSSGDSLSFPRLGDSAVSNSIRSYHRLLYLNDSLQNEIDIPPQQIPNLDMDKAPSNTGLLNGYAGEGLLRLADLTPEQHTSWMYLL
jgi:hypothetical protein